MGLKRHIEKRVRGWIPKEVSMPVHQRPVTHRFFPTHRAIVAFAALIAGGALAGALLGMLGNVLGLYSKTGGYWDLATGMVIGIAGSLIYGKIYRKEQQKEAKLWES